MYDEAIVLHRKLYGFQENHKHERRTLLVNHFVLEKVGKQCILFSLLIKTKKNGCYYFVDAKSSTLLWVHSKSQDMQDG